MGLGRGLSEAPLVLELEVGLDGLEYFGAWWLEREICKPLQHQLCSILSACWCCSMCAGQQKAVWERIGKNWCHKMPVISGKVNWLADIKNL